MATEFITTAALEHMASTTTWSSAEIINACTDYERAISNLSNVTIDIPACGSDQLSGLATDYYYKPVINEIEASPYEDVSFRGTFKLCSFSDPKEIPDTEKEMNTMKNDEIKMPVPALTTLPAIRYLYYNYDANTTVVVWEDGTVTKVKTAPSTPFSEYHGFCACVTKKVFGTNTQINKFIERNKEYHGKTKPEGE